jgi:PAS domain S-box-containing protein
LSQAVEQSLAAVAITNTNGEVEYVNQTFVELTGYEKNEIHGKKLNILRSLETTDEFYEDLWNTIKHGKSWKGEFHNKHKSGMLYWESVVISPIFDEKGQIVNFVKVSQDIPTVNCLKTN